MNVYVIWVKNPYRSGHDVHAICADLKVAKRIMATLPDEDDTWPPYISKHEVIQ